MGPESRTKARGRRWGLLAAALATALSVGVALPEGAPNAQPVSPRQSAAAGDTAARSEEAAAKKAQASGERVEATGLRNERQEVYAEPDGTFTAVEHTEPVRTLHGHSWVGIDTDLVQRKNGSWTQKAGTAAVTISNGGSGPFASIERAGRRLALSWPGGSLPKPTVTGADARFADVLPGVDLDVHSDATGFSHLLVIKSQEAAKSSKLASIALGLKTRGLTVTAASGGALRAEDKSVGGEVFDAAAPVMWDSGTPPATGTKTRAAAPRAAGRQAADGPDATSAVARVGASVDGDSLTLTPDQAMLNDAATTYPVVIDPDVHTTSRSSWTSVMSGMPDNSSDWKFSKDAGMGKCPVDYTPHACNGVGVRRLMYTMPVSFYRGKRILHATFAARMANAYDVKPTARPFKLYRVGGKNYGLTSSSTWNSTKSHWGTSVMSMNKAVAPTSCKNAPNVRFEGGGVTSQVQAAADGGWSKMTFGLRASDESATSGWKRFCGNAQLEIRYNRLPYQIKMSNMDQSPGGGCVAGDKRRYTDTPPKLRVFAYDPDQHKAHTERIRVQFKVEWGDSHSLTYTTPYNASGSRFQYNLISKKLPENQVVYWSARAGDGTKDSHGKQLWGPWSWAGDQVRCEFMYDHTDPDPPVVSSMEYKDDGIWHDGVGSYGTFRFTSPSTDVAEYRYAFDSKDPDPTKVLKPGSPGAAVSLTWMPTTAGRHWVVVEAIDKAGRSSTYAQHDMLVKEGRPVVGQWNMADDPSAEPTDAPYAGDETGRHPAMAGSGVTFGADGPGGKIDKAAELDGTDQAYLDTGYPVLDNSKSFTVSAWLRPTDAAHFSTAVSQDGTGEPGFTLDYDPKARELSDGTRAGGWVFGMVSDDIDALGSWHAIAARTEVDMNAWTHVTGVYDAVQKRLRIYVNGVLAGSDTRRSAWTARGSVQIGRRTDDVGYTHAWKGDIAEVRIFDRVVVPDEITAMVKLTPKRVGYWPLDNAAEGDSPDSVTAGDGTPTTGTNPLHLHGDATVFRGTDDPLDPRTPLVGAGHLQLDGDGDYADTTAPPVGGDTSFTLAARVRLTTDDPEKAETVFALPGAHASRFAVRVNPVDIGGGATEPRWELTAADADTDKATTHTVHDDQELPSAEDAGQLVTVVYDAFAHRLRLYVNGTMRDTAQLDDYTANWKATGGLQVGRGKSAGVWRDYLAGAVDEVRVYTGTVDPAGIAELLPATEQPDL